MMGLALKLFVADGDPDPAGGTGGVLRVNVRLMKNLTCPAGAGVAVASRGTAGVASSPLWVAALPAAGAEGGPFGLLVHSGGLLNTVALLLSG